MATSLKEFSTTAASNTAVGTANVDENCPPSGINNAIRQALAYIVDWFMNTGTISSATTTDLGTKTQNYLSVSGTTTITGFGTPTNKVEYTLTFEGALTLTHNATSLILPGGANIVTAAGDVAVVKHEGSGNWRCVSYTPATGVGALGGTTATAGKVLTANGSGSAPTWQTPATGSYAAKTSGYTIISTDNGDVVDFTTAGVTATLTAAATLGSGFTVTIANTASSGDVTIEPDGSETLDGLTNRLLRPGDRATIVCDGSNWKTVRGSYSFESSEQTLSLSTTFTVAHGLGEIPNVIRAAFRCKTIDNNWAVGDEIDYGAVHWTYGGALQADATNVRATVNQTYYPAICNKTTGDGAALTGASWVLVFYCKKSFG